MRRDGVRLAYEAVKLLEKDGIHATVLDMYCVKPLDKEAIVKAASNAKVVVTAEEHAPFGGLGSMVSQVVGAECPRKVLNIALPDAPVVSGDSQGALFGQGYIRNRFLCYDERRNRTDHVRSWSCNFSCMGA